jgi:hypothetical protein
MLTIVTACSYNHSKSMLNFLNSLYTQCDKYNVEFKCVLYDLGDLSELYKIDLLNKYPTLSIRIFDYSKYPSYFNVQINAGEYAWKPAIIYEITEELIKENNVKENILLWCDAGNLIIDNLLNLTKVIKDILIYSHYSSTTVKKFTHYKVLQYFNIHPNEYVLNNISRNGAIMGFYLENSLVQDFIKVFYNYAQIKDAICPDGSNRSNHRQDQSLFTLLYYNFIIKYRLPSCNFYISISIHNDVD